MPLAVVARGIPTDDGAPLATMALARLTAEDFNQEFASQYHATLVEEDTGWTPNTTNVAIERTVAYPTIVGILGPHCSCQVEPLTAVAPCFRR